MTLYKVLIGDQSCSGGSKTWQLPVEQPDGSYLPSKWHRVTGDIIVCENGLHLTTDPYSWWDPGCQFYEAEGRGTSDMEDEEKTAFREVRLLRPFAGSERWQRAVAFGMSLVDTVDAIPDGNPDPKWRLFTASTWNAAKDLAYSEAANRSKSPNGPQKNWAYHRALGALGSLVDKKTEQEYQGLTWARWPTACNTENDFANYVVLEGLYPDNTMDPVHRDHFRQRLNVWQKGYHLSCDVDGILYVYAGDVY